ncbi:MAG: hypothetical protein KatS3mg126_1412 [Lysobacteraceae bacterium]|nr:MAG: hypothetical protein KatS3mg126_1412 [Xanthomonadaceae bacterium]
MAGLRKQVAVRMHGATSGFWPLLGARRLAGLIFGIALFAIGGQVYAQSSFFDPGFYSGEAGTPLTVTLETRDGFGQPIGGGELSWELVDCTSSPSFSSPPPTSADSDGSTTATVLFSTSDSCSLLATWDPDGTGPFPPLAPASAFLTISLPALQATPLVPVSQILHPFAASPELRVQVTDRGSPYSGAQVEWQVYAPGQTSPTLIQGSTCYDTPFNTDAQGIATLDLGPSGINRPLDELGEWTVQLRAFRPGDDLACSPLKGQPRAKTLGASLDLSLTIEDVTIGFQSPPTKIISGQPATFTVQLTGQQSGNPVQGAPVSFTAAPAVSLSPTSGSQNTDANGLASFTITGGTTLTPGASIGASVNLPLVTPTTRSTSTTAAVSALSLTLVTPAPTGPTFTEETAAGFAVRADEDQGNGPFPVSGVPVTFTVLSGPGRFPGGQTTVVVNTDTSGIAASPALEVGRGNGPVVVEANGGPYGSLTQNYAVQPSTYTLAPSNTPTSITATQGEPVNLAVLLERAGSSTPVPLPGETVTWQISPSDGSTIAPQPSTTDSAGVAQVSFIPAEALVYTVTALFPTGLGSDPSVSFTVNAVRSSVFVLDAVEGNGQQGLVQQPGTPLGARLWIDGQPAPAGVRVDWQVQQGDVQLDASQSRTDADGVARMGFRFGATPSESLVLATSVFGTSTVFRVVATDQATLVIVSGDGQRAAPGTRLPEDFVVEARSASGGVLNGVQVFWAVRSGDGQLDAAQTTTDASGQARNRFTLGSTPGTAQVTAALATGQEVVFTATAATGTGTGRNLSIVRGDLQRGLVFTMADLPLEVRYADALGAPIAGATIEWEVQGDASLSATTTTTDMQGLARVDLTFGATPGPVQVIASAPGSGAMVSFSLASRLPLVVNVVGNDQSGPVGKPLPQPIGLDLDLPPNKALSGVPVQWQVLSGGGALASATTIADAQGRVRNSWTLGGLVGQQTVQATLPGGQQILFRAIGTLEGAVGSLRIVSGDQQALPTNAPSAPLVVEVLDTNGAPLADVPIEWEGDPTRVTLQSQQTRSGSDGRSSNVATILLPGPVEVSARIADTSLPSVTFRLLGGVARDP